MRLAARLVAARGGQEVRVPARVGNSRLLKPSRQASSVTASNVELDHHGNDAPPRGAGQPNGPGGAWTRLVPADVRRLRLDPELGASASSDLNRLSNPPYSQPARRPRPVYGAGVSRGGLDGARYEPTTPQMVYELGSRGLPKKKKKKNSRRKLSHI